MSSVVRDLSQGLRLLLGRPVYTALAVGTLALGIGGTTAVFSVTETVLLAPLPYPSPERAVVLWSSWSDFPRTWVSYDEVEAYREEIASFDEVGMFLDGRGNLIGAEEPERIRFAGVSENVFRILGVEPILGRGFLAEEDVPGGDPVIVLGHGAWQRHFAGDPAALGRTVELNGTPRRIVGVMPAGFRLPQDFGVEAPTQAWVPLAVDPVQFGAIPGPEMAPNGGSHTFYGLARLRAGADAERANRELRALTDRWNAEGVYQEGWDFRAIAVPVRDEITGEIRPALLVLLGAVALLLLLACSNVAGLSLVRGDERRREIGLRAALGAGRGRIVRQFLTEGFMLALAGGAVGMGVAWLGVTGVAASAPASLPRVAEAQINLAVVAFAFGLTTLATLLSSLLPAWRASRVDPAEGLREGGRGRTAGRARLRLRSGLVAGEVALAVVLAVAAGLMVRSVDRLLSIDPGFDPSGVLTFQLSAPALDFPEPADVVGFYAELRRRLEQLPEVRAAGAARVLPLATEIGNMGLDIDGYQPPPGRGSPGDWQIVTPGYMEAVDHRLLAGRFPNEEDRADAAPVLVINRTMSDLYFAGRDPIGGRIRLGVGGPEGPWFTVVGVVEDVRHDALTSPVRPTFYAPHAQYPLSAGFAIRAMTFALKTDGDPVALTGPAVEEVRRLNPRLPVSDVRRLDEVVASSVANPRFTRSLLVAFAAIALLLAAVGIYGVVSEIVASGRRELGIRLALGAGPDALVRRTAFSGLTHAAAGLALGLGGAFVLTRLMSGLVYGVDPLDPITFAAVSVGVLVVAAAATYLPARRVARLDPGRVLRQE